MSLDDQMPRGIGFLDIKKNANGTANERVLVDPLTKELIEKVTVLDEYGREKIDRVGNIVYEINDHWFRLDMKFIWKDAPAMVEVDE